MAADPGIWLSPANAIGGVQIPIDLIVPETLADPSTRRSAPRPGHDKHALRKARGIEAALVDQRVMTLQSLVASDTRQVSVKVAGPAALIVAKAHKIGEREQARKVSRLVDKDALDIYRLVTTQPASVVAATMSAVLLTDERSRQTTNEGLVHLERCFRARASTGTAMAVRALEGSLPARVVEVTITSYIRELLDRVRN